MHSNEVTSIDLTFKVNGKWASLLTQIFSRSRVNSKFSLCFQFKQAVFR